MKYHKAGIVVASLVIGIMSMIFAAQKIECTDEALKKLAKDAYIWGYPLVVMERSKQTFTKEGATPLNTFKRFDHLITPSFTDVVTPNVDTLYAVAWLNLEKEPLVLSVPDTNDRYYVIQFLDAYTNVITNVGKRATGTKPGTYLITGPAWQGTSPDGMTRIPSPTNLVWLICRVLVSGPEDLAVAQGILSKINLSPLSGASETRYSHKPAGAPQDVQTAGLRFFDELSTALAHNPPPAPQRGLVELFTQFKIAPGSLPSKDLKDEKLRAILTQALTEGEKEIDAKLAQAPQKTKNGWIYDLHTGAYKDDYLFRAAIAKQGLGANVAEEALYPVAFVDSTGQPLTGEHDYVVHFKKTPPVDAFWSLTIYDGSTRLLVPNKLNRYALSDRSNMTYNKDGSLDIFVQHAPPTELTNWLPAPKGAFYMVLRLYMPQKAILTDRYEYPTIKRLPKKP